MKFLAKALISFITVIILILGCQVSHPQRIAYQPESKGIALANWEEVFAKTPQIDSFKILNTGSVKVPLKGMLNSKKLAKDHPFKKQIWVEVYVFLFHHIDKGWYMIDTGLDSSFQGKGNISGLLAGNYIKDSQQAHNQSIAVQLMREQKDIQGIFFTHLHGDHTAGLPEIDSTIPKYVGKGETHLHLPLLYQSNHLNSTDTLIELDWESGEKIAPFESVMDIFGDGSFLGIHTPGHSNSHLSYLLVTSDGIILLTGDASHTKYGFENNIEPGWADDRDKAIHSLNQLRTFKKRFPATQVIYGHEQ